MLSRLTLLLLVFAPVAARAQAAEPFETLALSAVGTVDLGGALDESGYHRAWTPGPGAGVRVSTPFHLGRARAGIQFSRHESVEYPDYLAMLAHGGLGSRIALPFGLAVEPALFVGILSMDFYEDSDLTLAVRRESELVLGASADVSAPLARHVRAVAGVQAVQVYTTPRFRLLDATVGLEWTVTTPRWLRRLLD